MFRTLDNSPTTDIVQIPIKQAAVKAKLIFHAINFVSTSAVTTSRVYLAVVTELRCTIKEVFTANFISTIFVVKASVVAELLRMIINSRVADRILRRIEFRIVPTKL